MSGVAGGLVIHLAQHDLGRIIQLLKDVKANHSGFLAARLRVGPGSGYKRFEIFGFNADRNLEDIHGG